MLESAVLIMKYDVYFLCLYQIGPRMDSECVQGVREGVNDLMIQCQPCEALYTWDTDQASRYRYWSGPHKIEVQLTEG